MAVAAFESGDVAFPKTYPFLSAVISGFSSISIPPVMPGNDEEINAGSAGRR
jgi:hypothetical protein